MHPPDQDIRHRLLIARLPVMPQLLVKLVERLQADDLGVEELAALVACDAGMAGKLLAAAHGPACVHKERGASLAAAVAALGTDTIRLLVMGDSVAQTFGHPQTGGADLRAFWKRSLAAAVIARELARRIAYPDLEEAYLGGLLHDLGRLALLAAAPKEYGANFRLPDDEDLCAVEQRTLQITHAQAGAWLAERWQLDSFLADAVLYHHESGERLEGAHPLIRIVHLAHRMASRPDERAALREGAALCGVDAAGLGELLVAATREVDAAAVRLGIDLAGAEDPPPVQAVPPLDPVRQRLSDEVRNRVLVSEVGQVFARRQDEAQLIEAITDCARLLFDFAHAVVLLEDPTGQVLVGAPSPATPRIAGFALPLHKGGQVARAALSRRVAYPQATTRPGLAEEQLLRMLGGESMVCVPLVSGGRCLGVLAGAQAGWQLPICRQRESFLQAYGVQAAGALEAALAEHGQARRRLDGMAEDYRAASRRLLHEVNNPLAIIKNYLGVLDSKLERREPVASEMAVLNEEIDRVGQLIGSLGDIKPQEGSRPLDAGKVADEVVRLFRAGQFVPANVEISSMAEGEASLAEGNPDVLKQILVNLVKNAVEALRPHGGRIAIVNRGHVHRERRRYLELAVSDTGPGLAPEVMSSLFSGGPSTKPGAYRGQGLAIVHGLVERLDGHIACRSGSGGTVFEILLPAWSGTSAAPPAARAIAPR